MRFHAVMGVSAGAGVLLLTLCGTLFLTQTGGAQTASPQTLFATNCAACHGPKGDGDTLIGKQLQASDLRSPEIQKKTDKELTASITNGKDNKMPPFGNKLKAQEIADLIRYVRELSRAKK